MKPKKRLTQKVGTDSALATLVATKKKATKTMMRWKAKAVARMTLALGHVKR